MQLGGGLHSFGNQFPADATAHGPPKTAALNGELVPSVGIDWKPRSGGLGQPARGQLHGSGSDAFELHPAALSGLIFNSGCGILQGE